MTLADGVEVQLEPGRAGMTPEQVRAFIREVKLAYRRVRLVVDWKTTTTESGPV